MGGKLNLYNIGDLGVHLVETPVHSPDGSFTSAQNASVSQNQGQHGLRKRHGLAKLTDDALGGSVLSIGNIPFQDPFAALPASGTLLLTNLYNEGPTADFIQSSNGTTWASSGIDAPNGWSNAVFGNSWTQRGGVISTAGLITYIKTNGHLETWDGTTITTLTDTYTFGSFSVQGAPAVYGDVPVFAIADATSGKLLRRSGNTFEELTTSIAKPPICVAVALGRVYIGTDENRIYYWSESEGLVLDVTVSPTGGDVSITDIAHFDGVIYAACCTKSGGSTATTHKVLKRTADATWSDITPEAQGNYGPIAAFDGNLFVVRKAHDSFTGCTIHRYDGSSWSTDQDVTAIATGATDAISLVAWNDALYATVATATTRDIIRRSGGSWTRVHTESNEGTTKLFTALGFY